MVEKYLLEISSLIWGHYLIIGLLGVGLYYTIATGAVQIRCMSTALRQMMCAMRGQEDRGEGTLSSFQSLTNALASCVGNGNIVGVATAIASGGPGAVFWMWLTGLVGMATKYAEIVLGMIYREKNFKGEYVGGPMYYISRGMHLPWLGAIFAVLMFLQICGGGLIQANALSGVVSYTLTIPTYASGLLLALFVFIVVTGGIRRLGWVTEKIVPFMALLYIGGAFIVVVYHWDSIPQTILYIFESAFGIDSVGGGVLGYGVKEAMRFGIARGLYSNEAGEGSAPVMHATASVKYPHEQGLLGLIEVLVDTFVICSVSAAVILVSGVNQTDLSPAVYVLYAFESVAPWMGYIVFVSVILFAYSSILSQWYFGNVALTYLGWNRAAEYFQYVFMIILFVGAVSSMNLVWLLQDIILGVMIVPNLLALLWLRKDVLQEFRAAQRRKRLRVE